MDKYLSPAALTYYHSQIKDKLDPGDYSFEITSTGIFHDFRANLTPNQIKAAVLANKKIYAHFTDGTYLPVLIRIIEWEESLTDAEIEQEIEPETETIYLPVIPFVSEGTKNTSGGSVTTNQLALMFATNEQLIKSIIRAKRAGEPDAEFRDKNIFWVQDYVIPGMSTVDGYNIQYIAQNATNIINLTQEYSFDINYTAATDEWTTTLTPAQFAAAVSAKKRLIVNIPEYGYQMQIGEMYEADPNDSSVVYCKPVIPPIAEYQLSIEFYINYNAQTTPENTPYNIVTRNIFYSTANMNYAGAVHALEILSDDMSSIATSTNLLHNADWGYSLVNQRGHSGTVATEQHCIDRWYNGGNSSGTVTPSAGSYVTLASGTILAQKMEIISDALFGKSAVFAYQDSSGDVYSAQLTFPSAVSGIADSATIGAITAEIGFKTLSSTLICGVSRTDVPYIKITANSAVNIRRVWLELGSVCHMQNIPPKDYATNLLICQRYYYVLYTNTAYVYKPFLYYSLGGNRVDGNISLSVKMRVSPQVNIIGTVHAQSVSASQYVVTAVQDAILCGNNVFLYLTVPNHPAQTAGYLRFYETGGGLEFVAEL